MLVQFIGKGKIILEYDRKKYIFRQKQIKDIPVKVYDYLKSSRDIRSAEVIPYEEPIREIITENPVIKVIPIVKKKIIKIIKSKKGKR